MKYLLTQFALLLFANIALAQITNIGTVYVKSQAVLSFADDFDNTNSGEFWNNGNVFAFKNWNNDGVVDFTVNAIYEGLIGFIGTAPQTISGANFSNFFNVLFDNQSQTLAFQLEGNVSITNESDFTSGVINNKPFNGLFVFEQNADHLGASDESHVNGDVIKIGDSGFDFPIGNSTFYRSATISAPSEIDDTFTSEYFFENTNASYPVANLSGNLELIDTAEHWTIERNSGVSQVFLTLSLNTNTTPNDILNAPLESVHIARWDNALQLWVDQGGVQDAGSQTVSALVENYGVFTLAIDKEEVEEVVMDFPLFLTPNDDGYHDTWNINPSENREVTSITIFDRYGKLLAQLDPNGAGWDGTYNGKRLVGNDYWFIADYKDLTDNSTKQFRSHFTLKY